MPMPMPMPMPISHSLLEKKPAVSAKPRKEFLLSECLLATSTEGGIKDADLCFEVSAMHDARQTDLSSSALACIPIPTTTRLTHMGTHILDS